MAASLSKSLRLRKFFVSRPSNGFLAPATQLRGISSAETLQGGTQAPTPPPIWPSPTGTTVNKVEERGKWSKLLLFLPGAVTFGLGTWQIIRRQEKIDMIEHRQKRLEMEPIIWRNFSSLDQDLDSLEFRKVECEGVFNENKTVYIGPRSRSISGVTENGYYVITPLIPLASEPNSVQVPILVNRGWVPRDWRNKRHKVPQENGQTSGATTTDKISEQGVSWWRFWAKKPKPVQNQETAVPSVKVLGVARGSEKPSIFVPANDPESGQWFYVDVPMIAKTVGLPENTIYIEDITENASASNPYPVPKDASTLIHYSVMPRDHLNYTLTWYSLSAAVTFMAAKRIRPRKTRT